MKKTPYSEKFFFVFIGLILLVMVALFFSACSKKYCQNKYPCTQRDSITFIENLKIDTLYLPMFADTTYIQTPIDCPDQTIIYREGKKETQIIIKDKIIYLTATTKADSIRFILAYKDSKEFKTITQVKNIVEFKEKTPKWAWYSLGLVFILILWVTRKLWLNLIKFSI